jgi:hypothetical protein
MQRPEWQPQNARNNKPHPDSQKEWFVSFKRVLTLVSFGKLMAAVGGESPAKRLKPGRQAFFPFVSSRALEALPPQPDRKSIWKEKHRTANNTSCRRL